MATVTRYIDTASTAGGDGTTQAHTGTTRAYASAAAWESAEQADILTAGDIHEVYAAGTTSDSAVLIAGWTTGTSNYLQFAGDPTAPDGDGVNTTKVYDGASYYEIDGGTSDCFEINDNHVRVQDVQMVNSSATDNRQCIEVSGVQAGSDIRIERCRLKHGATGANHDAIFISDGQAEMTIHNNIIEWNNSNTNEIGIFVVNTSTALIFNNVIETAGTGIQLNAGTNTVKNNLIFSCTDDFSEVGGTNVIQFNAAEDDLDTELTETNNIILGTLADEMVGHTTGDYTPKSGGSLIDAGTTGGPSADILGVSYGTAEIGAIAFVAAGGNPWWYYHGMARRRS